MNSPEVDEYLTASRWRKPVYMVTGVKIARGASVTRLKTHSSSVGVQAGLSTDPSWVPCNVGLESEMSKHDSQSLSFEKSSDFVFAFRLRKITYDKKKPAKSESYNTGAMLGADDEMTSTEPQAEILDVSESDVNAEDVNFANKETITEKGEDPDEAFVLVRPNR